MSCARAHFRPRPVQIVPIDLAFLARRDVLRRRCPQHRELAPRARMCLWHDGQTGSRGSADPLDACDVEYFVGIFDGQVRSSLPLAHHCKPRAAAPAHDPDRADPPLSTATAFVPRTFCMAVEFSTRRPAHAFVSCCGVHMIARERVRCVSICVSVWRVRVRRPARSTIPMKRKEVSETVPEVWGLMCMHARATGTTLDWAAMLYASRKARSCAPSCRFGFF